MKHILAPIAGTAAIACATFAAAETFCPELAHQDTLPQKYQKRGPFYTDPASGWIIGQDQLRNKFAVSNDAVTLWHDIRGEFAQYGIELVVLAAPPRPLFAPSDAFAAMKLPDDANLAVLHSDFSAYIDALNDAGIIAPDLSMIAQSDHGEDYYFARDTHWTPSGAARSVAHLVGAMDHAPVSDSLARVEYRETYDEKGSLAQVVEDACGARPVHETVANPQYAVRGSATSLLGDTAQLDKIALVGTSFSDRYQRDAYQVAGALALMMDAQVTNYSVTGGGLVGSIEAFIRSGALTEGGYSTAVWEAPYSSPLTQVDGLRQVLGALHSVSAPAGIAVAKTKIGDDWTSINHVVSALGIRGLQIETQSSDSGQLVVELIGANGDKMRTKLVKSKRVASDLRSTKWAMAIDAKTSGNIKRIKLRLQNAAETESATVHFYK